jgi:hypothetical protein
MIEIKELKLNVENKDDDKQWLIAVCNEKLLEYVKQVSYGFVQHLDSLTQQLTPTLLVLARFAVRYDEGQVDRSGMEMFFDEQIQNTIRAYGLDVEKLWYLLLFMRDYVQGFTSTYAKEVPLLEDTSCLISALDGADEIIIKKDGRKVYSSSRDSLIDHLHQSLLYQYNCLNEMYSEWSNELASSHSAKDVEIFREKWMRRLEAMGLKDFMEHSTEWSVKSPDEKKTVDISYRQYKFAEIMLRFIKDIKPITPAGVKVKVYRERNLFVSMMMYVCGIYDEDEMTARDKWYEPYYNYKDNRNLSNLVKNYKYRKWPSVLNKHYLFCDDFT